MSDELIPLRITIPPGVLVTETPMASTGRWVNMDKVRFHQGKPEKIGGWQKKNAAAPMSGSPRTLLGWRANNGNGFIVAGTYRKLYGMAAAGETFTPTDITPIAPVVNLGNNPFATTNGSPTITVTYASHGLSVGDTVYLYTIVNFAGLTFGTNIEVVVVTVPTANTFTFTWTANANATTSGGGAGITAQNELPIGREYGGYGLGYGIGTYGTSTYGTARAFSTVIVEPRIWSMDHFGQIWVGTYNEGLIYKWDPSISTPLGTRASNITDGPDDARSLFVTEQRFVIALCADRVVKWCDQGNYLTWTPAVDNVAGQRTITEGTRLVGGCSLSNGISLIWTDTAVHIWQYTGSEFIFDNRLGGSNCGLLAPNAKVAFAGTAYWMSRYGFFRWAGSAQRVPNSDDVHAYVFDQLDPFSAYLCAAMFNPKFNEVWFFFVVQGSPEPSLYAIVDLDSYAWAVGALERVGGTFLSDGETLPFWTDHDGYLYQHETTRDANGAAMDAYITLAPTALEQGKRIMDIEGMEADFFEQSGVIELSVNTWDRIRTLDDTPLDSQVKMVGETDKLVDLRLAGRYAGFTIRSNTLDGFFRFGAPAVYIKSDGSRR